MKPDKKVTAIKTTITTLQLRKEDILNALCSDNQISQEEALNPQNCEIFVKVPGGGDYSNCTLDIDDCPINVVIKQVEEN